MAQINRVNSIELYSNFLTNSGLLSVADLTYERDIGLWQEMRDYWCRNGSGDCLSETATGSIVNAIHIDGKQKKYFCKSKFNCSLPNGEKKNCYSVIPHVQAKHFAYNGSCFHQKIVLSPGVASATGKCHTANGGS
ncbi:uncharacterized protein LOC119585465 [Penaeus monodon]|uniref:uncharacterized protein LOC119585465 n=1 Tax=Penaeus monodon TaxID=6687 RepID=UPI0018A7D566|nr:uncharacterized protein LOC119585465 [Penaeus monodon]